MKEKNDINKDQVNLDGKKLARIGEKTENVGPTSAFGADIPLYKLKGTDYLFKFDMVLKDFKLLEGQNGQYAHILAQPVTGIGPNGETGDITISTGAKSIMARLNALEHEDFPILARFKAGPAGPNQWFDVE